jgi:hypothetical protein
LHCSLAYPCMPWFHKWSHLFPPATISFTEFVTSWCQHMIQCCSLLLTHPEPLGMLLIQLHSWSTLHSAHFYLKLVWLDPRELRPKWHSPSSLCSPFYEWGTFSINQLKAPNLVWMYFGFFSFPSLG